VCAALKPDTVDEGQSRILTDQLSMGKLTTTTDDDNSRGHNVLCMGGYNEKSRYEFSKERGVRSEDISCWGGMRIADWGCFCAVPLPLPVTISRGKHALKWTLTLRANLIG